MVPTTYILNFSFLNGINDQKTYTGYYFYIYYSYEINLFRFKLYLGMNIYLQL